jgi:hypothetical protein
MSKAKFKISIIKKNNKGIEKIHDIQVFESRDEAVAYIDAHNAEVLPYKPIKQKVYYTMEGI